jgi:hypothetical protein
MAPSGGGQRKRAELPPEPKRGLQLVGSEPTPQRPPRTSGPVITARDHAILRWIGRHGIVTRDQVASRFFAVDNQHPGKWAAYRRVRILVGLGLLQEDHTFWREAMVLRLTVVGARYADVDVRPARLVLSDVRHALAVVDLVERLLAKLPEDTALITEREIRAGRRRDLRIDPTAVGLGRMPDAELHRSGKRIAVELDLTPKRSALYEEILTSYLRQQYDEVWWYVPSGVAERLTRIVQSNQADDFVAVRAWEG